MKDESRSEETIEDLFKTFGPEWAVVLDGEGRVEVMPDLELEDRPIPFFLTEKGMTEEPLQC